MTSAAILKVVFNDDIYRVFFEPELGLDKMLASVSELVPNASDGALTFGQHSPQLLTETTYDLFLAEEKAGPAGGGTFFRVKLQLPGELSATGASPDPAGNPRLQPAFRKKRTGAVRRAQRRQQRQAEVSAENVSACQWAEDLRNLDSLVSSMEMNHDGVQGETGGMMLSGNCIFARQASAARDKASDCATETTRGDGRDDVQEGASHAESEFPDDVPAMVWPPTPESSPPSSPRCSRSCDDPFPQVSYAWQLFVQPPSAPVSPTLESSPPSSPRCYRNHDGPFPQVRYGCPGWLWFVPPPSAPVGGHAADFASFNCSNA